VSAQKNFSALFTPASVCVAGNSRDPDGTWGAVIRNLISGGFKGKILPVNPEGDTLPGLPGYRKPSDIVSDFPPDLAVLCLPAVQATDALRAFGELGTRAALVLGAGHDETDRLRSTALRCGMILLGPGSPGIWAPGSGLLASPSGIAVRSGGIGFFARSGALCASLLELAATMRVGFSAFVGLGDRATVNEADMLDYFAEDPQTRVIACCLEYIEDGPRFLCSARAAANKKPVILFRIGRTAAGMRTVAACTGAVKASATACAAAFREAGIVEAEEFEELLGLAGAFDFCPPPQGPAAAVIADDWSLGAIAADCCEENGLVVPPLSDATVKELSNLLPARSLPVNPVSAPADASPVLLGRLAEVALRDAAALLLLVRADARRNLEALPDILSSLPNSGGKPILACIMGGQSAGRTRERFAGRGIPCPSSPKQAAVFLAALHRRRFRREQPQSVEIEYRHDKGRALAAVAEARAAGAAELSPYHAGEIMHAYEIPCLDFRLARTDAEAVRIAGRIGGPVALKIASPYMPRKNEARSAALNLNHPQEIRAAFAALTSGAAHPGGEAYMAGCMVQAMSPAGARETVILLKRDRVFGPMLLFGLEGARRPQAFPRGGAGSGRFSCRLLPLSLDDARDMVAEIMARPVPAGQTAAKEVNFAALEDILLILSRLALDCPEIEEIECSPVTADHRGADVVNVRILLAQASPDHAGKTET
jgi:acetyltransferase